jgi:hypothetical protein
METATTNRGLFVDPIRYGYRMLACRIFLQPDVLERALGEEEEKDRGKKKHEAHNFSSQLS